MWLPIFVSLVVYVSAEMYQDSLVFHKCCPENQSLIKVSETEESAGAFQCIDRESAEANYDTSISPLILGDNLQTEYGIPSECSEIKMEQTAFPQLNKEPKESKDNSCYDRLVMEVVNSTKKVHIPKIVLLSCVKDKIVDSSQIKVSVKHLRKCCPSGQSYDSNFHVCRNSTENTEARLVKRLNKLTDNSVYEVDIGLNCKHTEYGIELTEHFFSLNIEGNNLKATSKKDEEVHNIPPGDWCIDEEHGGDGLVARVCSVDCARFGAFCVRKCCPIGHHYRPRRCGSFRSQCVRNEDAVLFDINDYLAPLKSRDNHITDVMGVRNELACPEGRVVLNKSQPIDRHSLDTAGRLVSPISTGYDYCFEAFDLRMCPSNEIFITAVNCFIKGPANKDFEISFILISISSVCLGLTLVVYLSLPELRNLHGRTLICHTGTMLLAFSCLARVQYSPVPDNNMCTALGYGIYFGFVAAFAWLNVMCFDIWWTFGSVRTVHPMRKTNAELRRFLWYSLYAWSTAILMTLTTYLFDKYPVAVFLDANIGEGVCWFGSVQNSQSDWPHYIFFVIPLGIVTGTNFILWVLTARHCARVKSEVHRLQAGSVGDRAKRRFRVDRAKYVLTGKLWVVMGAGWISELLSTIASEPRWLWMIIDLINELQGVFIFLILVIKPKLYYLIRKRLGLEKPDEQKNGTSSSGRTSSTVLSRAISTEERTRISIQNNVKT